MLAVLVMLGGGVLLSGQQVPLLNQADVQAVVDFCMSPTGEKLMQPPEPTIDRATFCGGVPLGPGLVLAGMVRNVQALDAHEVRLLAIEQAIVSLEAQIAALQTPVDYQPQIDAINATLASVKAAIP